MFDCAEFFQFAKACQRGQAMAGEAALRTAISRAYYAAYHQAWLHGVNVAKRNFSSTGDAHSQVISYLRAHDDDLGDDLHQLREMRRRADYDLHYREHSVPDDAQEAIDLAYELLQRVRLP